MGSTWGNAIHISIFGESHGAGIGVVIDGFPSGVDYLDLNLKTKKFLDELALF